MTGTAEPRTAPCGTIPFVVLAEVRGTGRWTGPIESLRVMLGAGCWSLSHAAPVAAVGGFDE